MPMSTREKVNWVASSEDLFDFEPGTNFRYSNSGYLLLTYIIEEISRLSYDQYLEERIFSVCGMNASGVFTGNNVPSNMALGYSRDEAGKVAKPADDRHPGFDGGGGSAYSTVLDQHKFMSALMTGKLLSAESIRSMSTAHLQNSWGGIGYGGFLAEQYGRMVFNHPGGTAGFMAIIKQFMPDDVVIIALLNQDFIIAEEVFDRLAAIALDRPWGLLFEEESIPGQDWDSYAGEYLMNGEDRVDLEIQSGVLYMRENLGQPYRVYQLSENRGYVKELNARLVFSKSDSGEEIGLRIHYGIFLSVGSRISN
jgi:CubicO group peptidase (beta-lactamase class C family)